MSDVTTLKCWPSCFLAIDWSSEDIIALASSDHVELLFPNKETQESDRDMPQWQHFQIQVPWFTKAELPPIESAPGQIFSVGEEISTSYVLGIAWSPTGLARNGRCALAAHTANLALSLWASSGKPQEGGSWQRALIINDALEDYFSANAEDPGSHVVSDETSKWRLRRRIRAFSWAPALPADRSMEIVGKGLFRSRSLIAVSNDDNQIVVLAVKSPSSELGAIESWASEVLGFFSSSQDPTSLAFDQFTFDEMMDEQRYAMHLSWSPWSIRRDRYSSVIAYATNKDVRLRLIVIADGELHITETETVIPDIELRFAGPISWSPVVSNGKMTLALFTAKDVIILTVSTSAEILHQQTHHLDGRWDAVSAVAWDINNQDSIRLHFASHTMTTHCPTSVLEISSKSLKDASRADWPYWREHIKGSQGHFSAEHNLRGHARAKVWGLCTSPLGEFVASCHTVHPTDMIEYGTPADRRTLLAITSMRSQGAELLFPRHEVSTEAIFFSVRKWIEKNVESTDELSDIKNDIHQRLVNAYTPKEGDITSRVPQYAGKDLDLLISAFRTNAFNDSDTLKDRFEILATLMCTPKEDTELPRMLIAFRLANAVEELALSLPVDDELSQRVLENHRLLLRFIDAVMAIPGSEAGSEPAVGPQGDAEQESGRGDDEADEEGDGDNHDNEPERTPAPPPQPDIPLLTGHERCIFCDATIPFADISKAICLNGHDFVRCGLSFLAIQEPGLTKYCGVCDTPFLDHHVILDDGENDASGACPEDGQSRDAGENNDDVDMQDEEDGDRNGNGRENEQVESGTLAPSSPMHGTEDPAASRRRRDRANKSERELPATLARVLLLACDRCIYCGGKFVI